MPKALKTNLLLQSRCGTNNAILDELESFAMLIPTQPSGTLDQATEALRVAYQIECIDSFKSNL
jgi:hypothetical protein